MLNLCERKAMASHLLEDKATWITKIMPEHMKEKELHRAANTPNIKILQHQWAEMGSKTPSMGTVLGSIPIVEVIMDIDRLEIPNTVANRLEDLVLIREAQGAQAPMVETTSLWMTLTTA